MSKQVATTTPSEKGGHRGRRQDTIKTLSLKRAVLTRDAKFKCWAHSVNKVVKLVKRSNFSAGRGKESLCHLLYAPIFLSSSQVARSGNDSFLHDRSCCWDDSRLRCCSRFLSHLGENCRRLHLLRGLRKLCWIEHVVCLSNGRAFLKKRRTNSFRSRFVGQRKVRGVASRKTLIWKPKACRPPSFTWQGDYLSCGTGLEDSWRNET